MKNEDRLVHVVHSIKSALSQYGCVGVEHEAIITTITLDLDENGYYPVFISSLSDEPFIQLPSDIYRSYANRRYSFDEVGIVTDVITEYFDMKALDSL